MTILCEAYCEKTPDEAFYMSLISSDPSLRGQHGRGPIFMLLWPIHEPVGLFDSEVLSWSAHLGEACLVVGLPGPKAIREYNNYPPIPGRRLGSE